MSHKILGDSLNWDGSVPRLRPEEQATAGAVLIYRLHLLPRDPGDTTHPVIAFPPMRLVLPAGANAVAVATRIYDDWPNEPEHLPHRPRRDRASLRFDLPGTEYAAIHMIKNGGTGQAYVISGRRDEVTKGLLVWADD